MVEFGGTARYEVQRRIGAGGFGVVYQVRDRERDTHVALKTLQHLNPDTFYRFKTSSARWPTYATPTW